MQANFWHLGESIASSETPVFFKVADQPAAIAAIQASGFLPPAYAVTPNGEDLVDFIGPYVHWLRYADLRAIASADYSASTVPVAEVLGLCARICNGLADFAADQVIAACTDLSSLLASLPAPKRPLIPPKLGLASDFLLEFAVDCLKPMEYGTPFVHMSTSQRNKSWWQTPPSHAAPLARLKARRTIDFSGMPSALQSIDRWIDLINSRLGRMYALHSVPAQRQGAILEASAYCAAIAERHLMRCHHGQAILHLHRSLDLLLFSICDQRNIIDYSQHGGRYVTSFAPTFGSNRVTLINSFDAVKIFLAHHVNRESAFVHLNDWRNLLMHTHYMTGLNDSTTRGVFGRIRPHLQALGGSQWQEAHEAYLKGVQLTVADLLDVGESLSSTVQSAVY
jgi:hypothetical protein